MTELSAALRSLRRTPAFTAIAVGILAVGIGGSTAVFSVVNQVLLEPLPYADAEQLVRIYQYRTEEPDVNTFVTGPAYDAYRDMQSFAEVAATFTYRETGVDLARADGAERVRNLEVTSNYFDVLRAQPVLGRAFTRTEETPAAQVAVISHALWQRQFAGERSIVGRTLTLSGVPHTVVGVAPRGLEDPVVGAVDVWVPTDPQSGFHPQNHQWTVIGRLRAGVELPAARAELAAVHTSLAEQFPNGADRLGRMHSLHEDTVRTASRMLHVLLGAVGLVLLIVCVNIANLLLARATVREREFAVRSALGSGRGRIVRQLLLESLVLGLIGGVGGVLLGAFLLDGIKLLGASSVPRLEEATFDLRVLAFAGAVSIGSAVLFGLLPAWRFSRVAAAGVLRTTTRSVTSDRSRNRARSLLVGAQVALALMLLVGASLLTLSLYRLSNVETGIDADDVLTFDVHLPTVRYDALQRARFHEEFARRVTALPGVAAAGAVSRLPLTGSYHGWGSYAATGPLAGAEESLSSQQRVIAGDYFRAAGISLLAGRLFDERDDATAPRRAVISRSAAETMFPGVDAIGQTLLVLGEPVDVIGVVTDVALTPEGDVAPTVYHAHRQFADNRNWPLHQIVRTTDDPLATAAAAREILAAMDAELVLHRPQPLADLLGRGTAQRRFTTFLMTAFAALAVVLATLGLFGVITYTVRQRRREIGIRIALGARPAQIRGMVVRDGMRIATAGMVLGLAAALALGRVLASLVFETSTANPAILVGATTLMALVATLAAYLPAREATRVEPSSVLQKE